MNQINIQYFKSDYGELLLGVFNAKLCICDWRYRKMRAAIDKRITTKLEANYVIAADPVIDLAIVQLNEYFTGNRKTFDVPLMLVGTDFQKNVWEHLMRVPFGSTSTYLALSKEIGNVKAIRAVASANGANAISIMVPCHRIIGSDGKLIGYAGGLDTKQKLLQLENCSEGSSMTHSLELFNTANL